MALDNVGFCTELLGGEERPAAHRHRSLTFWKCSVLAVQFEGSLGKLTVSSVNNPRKMIDAVVTSRSEDDVSISRIARVITTALGVTGEWGRLLSNWQHPTGHGRPSGSCTQA